MAKLVNNQAVNIISGSSVIGPVNIPDGLNIAIVRLKRCTGITPTIWSNINTHITLDVYISLDNGVSWIYTGGCTSIGGVCNKQDNSEYPETTLSMNNISPGLNRQIKAEITVINGPFTSNITVEAI